MNDPRALHDGAAVAALVLFAAFAQASNAPRGGSWGEEDNCQELTFKGVSTQRYDLGQQIVSGRLTHTGRAPVRNVEVCGNGVCTVIEEGREMKKGESAEFVLNISSLSAVVLDVRCSVFHPD